MQKLITVKQRGFTLIELLVVISIIGVLASVVLASLNSARISARDAQRQLDLRAMKTALEMHFNDRGSYTQPETGRVDTSIGELAGGATPTGDWALNSNIRELVTQGYLPQAPKDPINDATYFYTYEPNDANELPGVAEGRAYLICATLEKTGNQYCVGSNWPGVIY
jgi:prepilin-type N-terminal cleavage/methylation domain-containing protein